MAKTPARSPAALLAAVAVLAALGVCLPPLACATPPAATPEALVQQVVAAAQQGDVAGVLACYTAEARKAITQSYADREELARALAAFQDALDARFGKGATTLAEPAEDLKAALAHLAGVEALSKKVRPDGAVVLRVKTTLRAAGAKTATREETLLVRKVGGAWKLAPGFASGPKEAAAQMAAVERVTQGVRSGEYKDRLAAMLALVNTLPRKGSAAK